MNPKIGLPKLPSQLIGFIALVIAVFVIAPIFAVVVEAGHVGILSTFGNVSDNILRPGLHFKMPFTQIISLSTRTEEYTMSEKSSEGKITGDDSIEALASDGASLWLDITVFYRLKDTEAPRVYKELGINFDEKIIRPEIRSNIREVVAQYPVTEVYSTKREEVQDLMLKEMQEVLDKRGIIVEEVLLRKVNLSEKLYESIELKLAAQQRVEQKEFEIQEAKREAERRKFEAEGQREAQRIVNESLTDNYLRYLYIKTLEQNENAIYVPTEGGLPLFKNVE